MSQSAWFSGTTVATWLSNNGFTAVNSTAASQAVSEVIGLVESGVGFSPFLYANGTRYFDPPRQSSRGYVLMLDKPLSGTVTIVRDWNWTTSTGVTLTQHTDWEWLDYNAAWHGAVKILCGFNGNPNSFKITGDWGYPNIPDDLYYAALAMAAGLATFNATAGTNGVTAGGLVGVKQGPVEFRFGSNDDQSFWKNVSERFSSAVASLAFDV